MSNAAYPQSITSYAFAVRGDLPSHHMGEFYRDAGLALSEFQTAMAAQIVHAPQQNTEMGRSGDGWRVPAHGLPDPRPSFAAPNRKWREEEWFHRLRLNDDGKLMTKDEFMKARETKKQGKKRSRDYNRNTR